MVASRVSRRSVLLGGAAAGLSLALPPARACEFFASTLRIEHPWTRATGAADTEAKLCMRFDSVERDERLIGASSPVAARIVLVDGERVRPFDLPLPKGVDTELSESGLHLRLQGLARALPIGTAFELELFFAVAGRVGAQFEVSYLPEGQG